MRKLIFVLAFLLGLAVPSWALQKNVTGQKWVVFAFDKTTNAAKTGDANNITATLYIDGSSNAVDDTNPTELGGGQYQFDLAQAETNGDNISIVPASTTANIQVVGCPGALYTTPPAFPALSIVSGAVALQADQAVNVSKINSVATTSVTAVNANIGTTQPINFTGTGASAYAKADAVNIGGAVPGSATIGTVTTLTNAPSDPSGVTTLLTRLSAARAGYLDYLDAAITSRMASFTYTAPDNTGITNIYNIVNHATYGNNALYGMLNHATYGLNALLTAIGTRAPSNTALSNVTWTDVKAGYLDAGISGRSSHSATDVAALILATPANKLATNASGYVTTTHSFPSNFASLLISADGKITVGTNNDKTGYSLSSAGIQAIWDALTSAFTTVGSIGKKLADWIMTTVY